jgi:cyclopropane-fatty-acyl-phospholipid synthase
MEAVVELSRASIFQKLFFKAISPMTRGHLEVLLPGGRRLSVGDRGSSGVQAFLEITSEVFFKRCVLYGDIGFGEAYMDGLWRSPDVSKVVAWFIANIENAPTLSGSSRSWSAVNLLGAVNRFYHKARVNHLSGSRRNIREHYDFSNDFFKLWLDPTMTYSSAWFDPALGPMDSISLEEAQIAKYDRLLSRLALKPGMRILEIGSGWGGFSIRAASRFGCKVVSLTLSENQLLEAKKRVEQLGLSEQVEFRLEDYRRVQGQFDRVVSIEMIEAVGDEFFEDYFAQCYRLLRSDGLLALQGILCPDSRYRQFKKRVDWIQRHIFPGSLLPSFGRIHRAIRRSGDLDLISFEEMGLHYAETLRRWDRALLDRAEEIRAQGHDDREIRRWSYYFNYCAGAFQMRNIMVAQMVFSRPNNPTLVPEGWRS